MSDEIFDFGFTFADADELEAVQEIKQKVDTTSTIAEGWQEQAEQWKEKANKLHDSIVPLLENLRKDTHKEYIYWPGEKRKEVIEAYQLKLLQILEE